MRPSKSTPRCEKPALTIVLDEYNQHGRAVVRLHWNTTGLVGRGLSPLDAGDDVEHSIGQKLALARALSHLVRQLFTEAAHDIECALAPRSA